MLWLKKRSWNFWRLLVQTLSFALLITIPLLNYYLQFDFIQGWYQSISFGDLWFVSPLEGLERILVTRELYGPLLVGMALPVVLAFLCGRVFCGWICPIHYLSELSDRIRRLVTGKKQIKDRWLLPRWLLWIALIGELLLTMIIGAPLFVFLSPPGLVGRELMRLVFFNTLAIEGLVVVAVLLLNLITRRFFCRYMCPLGGLLSLVARRRKLRVVIDPTSCSHCNQCDKACPLGLEPQQGGGEYSQCWNCGACVDACSRGSLTYRWGSDEKKTQKTN
ncbi:MAG: nitrate reductase [Desulfobacteraceae bacterium 4572_35.1]|nr:MAG: nitrate reductase [Desulfobacteraceae bacterium 4572_35.1]